MTLTEYLLTCLVEECAEIQQAATKALRFGLDQTKCSGKSTNKEDIIREYCDVLAIMDLLSDSGIILRSDVLAEQSTLVQAKKARVKHYMNVSKQGGTLDLSGGTSISSEGH